MRRYHASPVFRRHVSSSSARVGSGARRLVAGALVFLLLLVFCVSPCAASSERVRQRADGGGDSSPTPSPMTIVVAHASSSMTSFRNGDGKGEGDGGGNSTSSNSTTNATTSSTTTTTTTATATAATIDTWAPIKVSAIISAMFLVVFLTVFECARRAPSTSAVFDRKREVRPGRTPPALARGLCRHLFEWLFVEGYTDVSYAERTGSIVVGTGGGVGGGGGGSGVVKVAAAAANGAGGGVEVVLGASSGSSGVGGGACGSSVVSVRGERRPSIRERRRVDRAQSKRALSLCDDGRCPPSPTPRRRPPSPRTADEAPELKIASNLGETEESWSDNDSEMDRFDDEGGGRGGPKSPSIVRRSLSPAVRSLSPKSWIHRNGSADEGAFLGDMPRPPELVGDGGPKRTSMVGAAASDVSALDDDDDDEKDDVVPKQPLVRATRHRRLKYLPVRPGFWVRCFGRNEGPTFERQLSCSSDQNGTVTTTSGNSGGEHCEGWKIFPILHPAPLSDADSELLRCVGLDAYVAIRFLRFGFDVTFYPFLFSLLTLIPIYLTNEYDGETMLTDNGWSTTTTSGYFRVTINSIENRSHKLYAPIAFAVLFQLYFLRRLYLEWIVFMELREDFMAHGDPDALEENGLESVRQFRRTCLVECVPKTHRSDRDLWLMFDSLFPGHVVRAELVVQCTRLGKLIQRRQSHIEQYEELYARHYHRERVYERELDAYRSGEYSGCLSYKTQGPVPPAPPEVYQMSCCDGKVVEAKPVMNCVNGMCAMGDKVEALPYLLREISRLNELIEQEYRSVVVRKSGTEEGRDEAMGLVPQRPYGRSNSRGSIVQQNLKKIFTPKKIHAVPQACGNGFVEFSSVATKMSAMQCNLTGKKRSFAISPAPDPRDLVWSNTVVEKATTDRRKFLVELLLLAGILCWAALFSLISHVDQILGGSPGDDDNESGGNESEDKNKYAAAFVSDFLPVLITSWLLILLSYIFRPIGLKVVLFKSNSANEIWVIKWHLMYRIVNFLALLLSDTLWEFVQGFQGGSSIVREVIMGILEQSQFFFSIMLVLIGFNLTWQISQPQYVVAWMLSTLFSTEEGKSQRRLQSAKTPRTFNYGLIIPEFIYCLIIALVYAPLVPLIIGMASLYFFLAAKVYAHQCLFVFVQPYEGGGVKFFLMSRMAFFVLYVAILVFAGVLALKDFGIPAFVYGVIMLIVTASVHRSIGENFVHPCQQIPLTSARIMDEETKGLLAANKAAHRGCRGDDGDDRGVAGSEELDNDNSNNQAAAEDADHVGELSRGARANRVVSKPILGMGISENGGGSGHTRNLRRLSQLDVAMEEPRSDAATASARSGTDGGARDDDDDGDEKCCDYFLYRQPALDRAAWETKPRPYRGASRGGYERRCEVEEDL